MALVGNLRDFGLADFLYLVDHGLKTGMLVLQRPGDEARLYFQSGKLVYAIQNATEERLGDLLLAAGKISEEQRDYALHTQKTVSPNKPVGLILVELGYITREGIIRAVRSQIEETVYRLFGWTDGEFRFEPDVSPPRESVTIPLGIENIIMEGVRRIDEWSRIKDRIPTLDAVVRFMDQPTERSKGVNLTPDEWRVFARINGNDNIATVARMSGLSEFEACKIIYGFLQAGLVELVRYAPVATPAPAPPATPAPGRAPGSGKLPGSGILPGDVRMQQVEQPPAIAPQPAVPTPRRQPLPQQSAPRSAPPMQASGGQAAAGVLPSGGWGPPRVNVARSLIQRIVDSIKRM